MIYSKIGEIVKNHFYIREIQSLCGEDSENKLVVSKSLYEKLSKIYEYIGIKSGSQEVKARIQLPSNPNPQYRREWNTIELKASDERPQITIIDSLARYYKKEVVLASDEWLYKHESIPGDPVIISPCLPIPDKTMILCK